MAAAGNLIDLDDGKTARRSALGVALWGPSQPNPLSAVELAPLERGEPFEQQQIVALVHGGPSHELQTLLTSWWQLAHWHCQALQHHISR